MYLFARRDPYVKNVRDFEAKGDGVTDDTTAIQNAVNWTSGPNRGTIYFPVGTYIVSQPITYNYDGNLSICFRGENSGSIIKGNVNGYILDRALATPNNTTGGRVIEKLNLLNGNTGANTGCIRMGSTYGGHVRDCVLRGQIGFTSEDAAGVSSQNIRLDDVMVDGPQVTGCSGFIIGGSGAMTNCRCTGTDVAFRIYGNGFGMMGNRCERSNTGWLFGLDSSGNNVGASGFSLGSVSTEGVWTSVDFSGTCTGFIVSSIAMIGHDMNNAGMSSTPIKGSQYGILVRANAASAGVIQGISMGQWAEIAAIEIDNATSRTNLVVENCSVSAGSGGGQAWVLPTNAYTAMLRNCNVQPIWTSSQLPSGGNVLEGDEFNVSDVNGTWGTPYTGGGTTRGLVRWNGSNWTVAA